MTHCADDRRRARLASLRRGGFTMIEILTSVTLALMLMYAVARIFSRVGSAMNETTSVMEMASELRNARERLRSDLTGISTPVEAPQNSARNLGYFCYVEGMGGPFNRISRPADGVTVDLTGDWRPFTTGDVALDTERFLADPGGTDADDVPTYEDNTVGDLDDILSFTARAPEDHPFRGRYIEPIYNDVGGIIGGRTGVFESNYAEVVWFVRGTTLYRRVLPIIPNALLQDSLEALRLEILNDGANDPLLSADYVNPSWNLFNYGLGFFRFYDASVHMGENGRLVANTLGDLTNRKNRFFYWNSCGLRVDPAYNGANHATADANNGVSEPLSIHGRNSAWYWLRMPTLMESAAPNFRAGAPFGSLSVNGDFMNYGRLGNISPDILHWKGYNQQLYYVSDGSSTPLPAGTFTASAIPFRNLYNNGDPRNPFIDFWFNPNVWEQVNYESGDLNDSIDDVHDNSGYPDLTLNDDVVLTNVLSFNVRAWDPDINAFVDLGSGLPSGAGGSVGGDPDDLRSDGYYGLNNPNGTVGTRKWSMAPCVYDTWSEQYQRDYEELCEVNSNFARSSTTSIANVVPLGQVSEAAFSASVPTEPTPPG